MPPRYHTLYKGPGTRDTTATEWTWYQEYPTPSPPWTDSCENYLRLRSVIKGLVLIKVQIWSSPKVNFIGGEVGFIYCKSPVCRTTVKLLILGNVLRLTPPSRCPPPPPTSIRGQNPICGHHRFSHIEVCYK